MPNENFYVYVHKKKTNGDIFYVGKGTGNRLHNFTSRSKFWKRIAKKYGVDVEIVISGVQEWYAFETEVELIASYGRIDNGTGTLVNHTDGGDGCAGRKCSDATKAKMSAKATGRKMSPESVAKTVAANTGRKLSENQRKSIADSNRGRKMSPESVAKTVAANTGRKRSDESRKRMSEAQTGKKRSTEAINKIAEAIRGIKRSEETKAKISGVNSANADRTKYKFTHKDGDAFIGLKVEFIKYAATNPNSLYNMFYREVSQRAGGHLKN